LGRRERLFSAELDLEAFQENVDFRLVGRRSVGVDVKASLSDVVDVYRRSMRGEMASSVKEVEGAHACKIGCLVETEADKLVGSYEGGSDDLVFCDSRCRRDSFGGLSGNSVGKVLLLWSNAIFQTQIKATMRPEMETARIRCGLAIFP
jgi:hypothetical protein